MGSILTLWQRSGVRMTHNIDVQKALPSCEWTFHCRWVGDLVVERDGATGL